ncbi:MAG: hypothetical protein WBA48_00635 [Xanthobacteraceae bacterium]
MAKRGKKPADDLIAHDLDGVQVGLLADEDTYDRRTPWRLASWGIGAVGAVTIAVLANQSYVHKRQDQVAVSDLARRSEQIQAIARESRNDIRRLSAAIDTLNGDRDRLYARATALEQGLESVTGSINRQNVAFSSLATSIPPLIVPDLKNADQKPAPSGPKTIASEQPQLASSPRSADKEPAPSASPNPTTAAVAKTPTLHPAAETSAPAASLATQPPVASKTKSETADAASDVTASIPADPAPVPEVAVPRTTFGVDLGTASSIGGLRALWRRITATHQSVLGDLQPVIALRERKSPVGVQLRLVAGPLDNAARAAEICAAIAASRHSCATTTFEGQKLAMDAEPAAVPHPPHRRSNPHHGARDKPTTARPPSATPATQSR